MRKPVRKAIILVFAAALISAAGCQEAQTPSGKKSRLVAAENIELKKQLAQRDRQIEDMKAQYTVRLKLEEKKLADCQKKTADCREELKVGIDTKVNEVLAAAVEESAKLRMENAALKAEIAELKAGSEQPEEPEKKE